jgi:urease accessory protein
MRHDHQVLRIDPSVGSRAPGVRAPAGISRAAPGAAAGAGLVAGSAQPALAHGSATIGEFYSGLLHPLIHFETALPTLALGLWAVQLNGPDIARMPIAFLAAVLAGAAATFAGTVLPGAAIVLHATMLVLGACAAAALRLPIVVAGPLAVIAGVAVGTFTAVEARAEVQRPLLYVLGVPAGLALLLVYIVGYLNEYRERFQWLRIATRVAGSWIAATGLLVLVLDLAGPRPQAP